MSPRVLQLVAVLWIISFVVIAAHVYLLHERPSNEGLCPFCHWLQSLMQGEQPTVLVVGGVVMGRASPEPVPLFSEKPHRLPFSARAPPSA